MVKGRLIGIDIQQKILTLKEEGYRIDEMSKDVVFPRVLSIVS